MPLRLSGVWTRGPHTLCSSFESPAWRSCRHKQPNGEPSCAATRRHSCSHGHESFTRARDITSCVSPAQSRVRRFHCVMHQQINHNLAQCQASQLRDVTVTVAILQFSFSVDQTDASSQVGGLPCVARLVSVSVLLLCRRFLCGRFCSPLCSDLGDRCLHQSESSSSESFIASSFLAAAFSAHCIPLSSKFMRPSRLTEVRLTNHSQAGAARPSPRPEKAGDCT